MKTKLAILLSILLALTLAPAGAVVRYVNLANPNPAPPYTTWASAATNIQDAIDAADAGDEIVVTNGVYQSGGRVVDGEMMNRVAVDKPLTVRSVNGPKATVIRGYQVPDTANGDGAVRCVYLTSGAVLVGFTLTNGATRRLRVFFENSEVGGGGVWCESGSAVLSNCVLSGNSAFFGGGGASGGTLNTCTLTGNGTFGRISIGNYVLASGGGAAGSTLNNCALNGNSAGGSGGGAVDCTLNNCTLTSNSAFGSCSGDSACEGGGGAAGSTLNNCTLTSNSAGLGGGAKECMLNNCTLTANSASDYGGGAWGGTLNNCIVYFNTAPNGANHINAIFNYSCTATLPTNGAGNITNEPAFVDLANVNLRLRPGSPCIDAGTNLSAIISNDLDGRPRPLDGDGDGIVAFDMGAYEYRALHVWQESPSPAPPFVTWATAATNIQDAIDAALPGDDIVVTNGVYKTGGRAVDGTTINRVTVTKALTLRSVNGSEFTAIEGSKEFHVEVRCVYLTNGATLVGFTLTSGGTGYLGGGGGVCCPSASAVVSNCVLSGNVAYYGGGAYGGTLNNCTLSDNEAFVFGGGGAWGGTLNYCTLTHNWTSGGGGGACYSTLSNCTLTANSAPSGGGVCESTLNHRSLVANYAWVRGMFGGGYGGGASGGTLSNCRLTDNSANREGGGVYYATLNNCTLAANSASGQGGGAWASTLNNCIVYFNTAPNGANFAQDDPYIALNYCCSTPLPPYGLGNFTNAPLFVDQAEGNLRLQANSACINSGFNAYAPAGSDVDGNLRIVGGTVDVGAYEFQSPQSAISYAWLQGYGLPTDGSADLTDTDGDGLNTWQEWRCLTDPTNALSVLRLLAPASGTPGVTVRWQSVANRTYFLERSTNFGVQPSFGTLASNLLGQAETTVYTDTNAVGTGPLFYRVGVQE